ncbi:hypothetical protein GH714_018986 [Hevea brasiliensis]|uniref:Carotenoid cleavage dioxygenase 7 n=1 Tax=Hevea brasiliensis TaxID=3981 RepID=A0A6A6LU17_HEVBR|nr:hypothetical protein GH714_018986 [Hevea brasiliensis]
MQAKPSHIIPTKFPSPIELPPLHRIPTPARTKIPRVISISAPDNSQVSGHVTLENIDDSVTAFWDYQFLFVSQRSETVAPVTLRVVDGAVPPDFPSGTYYLTGPGLFTDDHGSTVHPLDGHGYLRAFIIDGVTAEVKFMARYVKTEAQVEEHDPETGTWRFTHRGPFSVLKGGQKLGNTKVMKNVANTSVLKWGGRLLCLWEGGIPYEIESGSLDTIGRFDMVYGCDLAMDGADNGGDLVDVAAEYDSDFNLLQRQKFNIPDHLMIHDWAFTDTHYILFANRIKLDVIGSVAAVCGLSPMISALSVNPSKSTSPVYLLPRFPDKSFSYRDWRVPVEAPSQMWLMHVGNAFEVMDDNGNLEVQVMLAVAPINGSISKECLVSINLDADGGCQACSIEPLNQWTKPTDFPVINPTFSGNKNTYIYAATSSGSRQTLPHFPFDMVVKLNVLDKSINTWSAGARSFIGEPIFVPKPAEE